MNGVNDVEIYDKMKAKELIEEFEKDTGIKIPEKLKEKIAENYAKLFYPEKEKEFLELQKDAIKSGVETVKELHRLSLATYGIPEAEKINMWASDKFWEEFKELGAVYSACEALKKLGYDRHYGNKYIFYGLLTILGIVLFVGLAKYASRK